MTKTEKQIIALNLATLKTLATMENKIDVLVSEVNKAHDMLASQSPSNRRLIEQMREISKEKEKLHYKRMTDLAAVMYASLGPEFEIN